MVGATAARGPARSAVGETLIETLAYGHRLRSAIGGILQTDPAPATINYAERRPSREQDGLISFVVTECFGWSPK